MAVAEAVVQAAVPAAQTKLIHASININLSILLFIFIFYFGLALKFSASPPYSLH